jgi:formylglycine-generating enzyme required for sulfatase activity/dipeptide/tripeptide permease
MAAGPEQRSSSRSVGHGAAAAATDELSTPSGTWTSDADKARYRLLVGVAIVEFCAAAGDSLARDLAAVVAPPSAVTLCAWVAFIGAIPGGWLGDRFFGAKRATVIGALLSLAGFAAVAVSWPGAIYLGLAMRAVGVALLRGNTFVLVGRAMAGSDRHRLEVFLWIGFAASVGGALASELHRNFPAVSTSIGAVIALAILCLVAIAALRKGASVDTPGPIKGSVRVVAGLTATLGVTVVLVGLMSSLAEGLAWWTAIGSWLFIGSTVFAAAVFLGWWLLAARRMPHADNRRIGNFVELASYAVVLGAFSALASGDPDEPWPVWQRSVVGLLFVSIPFVLRWRARAYPAPSAAGVFSVAFFLQSVALIAFATLVVLDVDGAGVVQLVLDALVIYTIAVAGVLVLAAGRSAATSLAPAALAGTMLGLWRTSGGIGSSLFQTLVPPGSLDRDTLGVVLLAAAAACVFLGLQLQARRSVLATYELAEVPPAAPRSRLRRVAMAVSSLVAILGTVWVVVGRNVSGGEVVAAGRPLVFGNESTAYLPDDGSFGFVQLAAGAFLFSNSNSGQVSRTQSIDLDTILVARYEVTVAQYRQCVNEGGCRPADTRAIEPPDEWPVRHVSWYEARDYCAWLQQKLASLSPSQLSRVGASASVALPSEPEWERASASGGAEGYPWLGPLAPSRANYVASGRLGPVPVGEFTAGATAEGIHDLSGNVAEWTRSEYRPYPYDAGDGREDAGSRAATRVIRGGSFYDAASALRVTARQAADPARGYEFVGFRVVITRQAQSTSPTTTGSAPPEYQAPATAQ